tara:strand:+ start:740 stop:1588 length:849 start_codon:yes stop_codon:yes gene_type:complete
MYKKTSILKPQLQRAQLHDPQSWPTFDGGQLDRSKFVSSSQTGMCARSIWYSHNQRREVEPDTDVPQVLSWWGFAQRGHGHEAWVVAQLTNLGDHGDYYWTYVGDGQRSFYAGAQSGTPDGVIIGPHPDTAAQCNILFEHKSIDPRTNRKNLPKKQHLMQVVQNMDLVEHCLDMPITGALLAYSDASDFSLIDEYWIDRDQPEVIAMMLHLEERAIAILAATSADDVAPEGLADGSCKNCDFGALCSAAITAKQQDRKKHASLKHRAAAVFGQPKASSETPS